MKIRALGAVLVFLLSSSSVFGQTRLYTLNGNRYLTVLDAVTLQQLARLDLLTVGNPLGIVVTNNGSRAYVGLGGSPPLFPSPGDPMPAGRLKKVAVVDLITLSVLHMIDVGGFPGTPVASPSGDRVYVPTDSGVAVIRTTHDSVISTIAGAFGALALSPDGSTLYSTTSSAGVVEVDTGTFAISTFTTTGVLCLSGLAVSPDGSRLYESGACPAGGGGIRGFDIATRTEFAFLNTAASSIAVTPDGTRLVATAGDTPIGVIFPTLILNATTLSQLGSVDPTGQYVGIDAAGTHAYVFGGYGTTSPNFFAFHVTSIDLQTLTVERTVDAEYLASGFAVAPLSPCGQFLAAPAFSAVTTAGGSGSFTAPVPAGCAWSVTSTDPSWLTITSPASGVGPATITFSAGSSSVPRTAELRINGQVLPVYQTRPLVMIDSPAQGTHVKEGFQIAGWVADLATAGPASTALNDSLLVHVWAYPSGGGAPQFIGQTTAGIARPDVAAVFPGYRSGGFSVLVTGLSPGSYTFVAYLFSPYLTTFAAAQTVTVTIDPSTFTVIDTLAPNASVTVPFRLGGWALDGAASSGTGVDVVNVYAYPDSGGPPLFAGSAVYGGPRSDLTPYFGNAFFQSGFGLAVDGLAPGGYTMVAYAHSTVSGAFTPAVVHVTVTGAAEPFEIETFGIPSGGNPRAIFATGWAADRRAPSGTGVLAVQAWAYPANGGAPIFIASATMPVARADIAAIYGSRYLNAGWTLGGTLPSGTFDVAFFALSAATGQFDNVRVRRITIP